MRKTKQNKAPLDWPEWLRCKQNLKNETKQSGQNSEYRLNQARSGALLWLTFFTDARVDTTQWLHQIVYIVVGLGRKKKKRNK